MQRVLMSAGVWLGLLVAVAVGGEPPTYNSDIRPILSETLATANGWRLTGSTSPVTQIAMAFRLIVNAPTCGLGGTG
jgi:hypothetical protein